jgi:hypothetical protein
MHHDLKIWPRWFQRVKDGSKTFEVRNNDRGFQMGDTVSLQEWDPDLVDREVGNNDETPMSGETYTTVTEPRGFTGAALGPFRIGYVHPLSDGQVVFSLIPKRTD